MTQRPANAAGGPRERATAADEEPAEAGPPLDYDPPVWMIEDEAKAAWGEGLAILGAAWIKPSQADLSALARWAQFRSDWLDLTRLLQTEGLMQPDRFGISKPHPAIAARDGVERSMRNLEKALGLDPDSNASLRRDLARTAQDRGRGMHGSTKKRVGGFLQKKGDGDSEKV